jgi:hypothetical protein
MTRYQQDSPYATLKSELDVVQRDFVRLVNAISDEDWKRKLPGSAWTAKGEMAHTLQALEVIPKGIDKAISGKSYSLLSYIPGAIRGWVNGYLIVPALAKRSTKDSLIQAYQGKPNLDREAGNLIFRRLGKRCKVSPEISDG